MKRNINLIELSRDHHHGLLLGWKIKQGLKKQISHQEIFDYVLYFAKQALVPHFQEEEKHILCHLAKNDKYRITVEREHLQVLEQIHLMSLNPTEQSLLELAEKIEKHIRYEEREVFPYLEKKLTESQLATIGEKITQVHHPYKEDYENDFWNI